jgi:uncharacterized protein YjcR
MKRSLVKMREEARRLFLTGEVTSNAEIAARLKVKAHTIGRWHREEDWGGLRAKIDIRAAEMFIEKIATERVTLNVLHHQMWAMLLSRLAEDLKGKRGVEIRELEKIAGILEKAQRGQRLAKGLSLTGETEEAIRAQAEGEIRQLIDAFIDSVKENVKDEETRERIHQALERVIPGEEREGAGEPSHAIAQ